MIWSWTVTSSAVVGSTRQSNRDHCSLTHPTAELVRIFVEAALGGRDTDTMQRVHGARTRVGA
jgi:hypothetical protein